MILKTDLISGAGNTFHISMGTSESILGLPTGAAGMKEIARQICENHKADGLIFLEPDERTPANFAKNFKWYFFNNDGSDAEMCGNATRCIGYFLKNKIKNELSEWSLKTTAGPIKIEALSNQQFRVTMSPIQKLNSTLGFFCDTGVPHLVLETKDKNIFLNLNAELKRASSALRFHSELQPRGTNVTYVYLENEKSKIKAVSYERGVEGFTEACGTGAMAAAFFNLTKRSMSETEVEMPGGTLIMNLQNLNQPIMTGSAELLGSFENEI